MLTAGDGAEAVAGLKAARGEFAGEQAGNDAVFGADARGDDAPDVSAVAGPAFRPQSWV